MTNDGNKEKKDSVTLVEYGKVDSEPPLAKNWPSGEMIKKALEKQNVDAGDATYWQTSARWALLGKFGHLPEDLVDKYVVTTKEGTRQLSFSDDDIKTIQTTWENLQEQALASHPENSDDDDDLLEFMRTSKSCGRQLQWTLMECDRATQFKLHAHPNLELIYCVQGSLHEIRMSGKPLERKFGPSSVVQGPNLLSLDRSWYFATLNQGEWLCNEVGSIHKSFTATNGNGCILLVLWGGSHADVIPQQHPKRVNVQQALDSMDDKLSMCADCNKGNKLSETFLPESERGSS